MSKIKYRPLENPIGRGVVYKNDEEIAKVSYELIIKQEVNVMDDGTEFDGLKDLHGEISVVDGRKNLLDMDKMTLHLEDGRYIDFRTGRECDENKGKYHILPLSDFRTEL